MVGALQRSRAECVVVGQRLLDAGSIYHVAFDHVFEDEMLFFRFASNPAEAFPKVGGFHVYSVYLMGVCLMCIFFS
jgi:hypothetical protein